MNWLTIALGAYLLLAVANLLDKFLVDNVIKNSRAYAFAACVLGLVVVVISPWFLKWPGPAWFLFNILAGFIFAVALWFLYEALRRGEAARTLVFIGGLTPIFSIFFSILFFKEIYSFEQWLGMGFLLAAVLVISLLPQPRSFLARLLIKLGIKKKLNKPSLIIALFSALAYSLYFIATKHAYNHQPFLSAFIWTRIGAGVFVLFFLFQKQVRLAIYELLFKAKPVKNRSLVIVNQGIGSAGFILQNYAIALGPVAIINAMQGFQYAFLLILSAVLATLSPRLLRENFSWRIILQKLLAIILVAIGLYFIASF